MNDPSTNHLGYPNPTQELVSINKELTDLKFALDVSSIIAVTDVCGKITSVNKKFCELSKYSEDELLGQDHRILNSGYHSKEFFRNMWKTIASGQVWKGEIRNKTKDGNYYWVNTTIVPILKGHQKPDRYISIRIDITEQKQMEAELQKALMDDFTNTVKHLENGVFKIKRDESGKFTYTMGEGKLLSHMGFNMESHAHMCPHDLFPKEVADYKVWNYEEAFQGERVKYEFELGDRLLFVDLSPIKQEDQVIELVGSIHDVTELRFTQRKLQEHKLLYESLFYHSQDAVFSFDPNGRVININPAMENLLGYSFDDLRKKNGSELIAEEYLPNHLNCFRKALNGEPQNLELVMFRQDGERIYLNLTYLPIIIDHQITGIYAIGKDISEEKKIQELNAFLANHDELTKLLNRRGFEEKLFDSIENANLHNYKLAIMYMDLDRFKHINDTLGHYIGDRLLEKIATRLSSCLGKGNFLARMGGDEFMVLIPAIDHEDEPVQCANELLDCIKEPFFIDDYELYVTASIGISIYPSNGETVVDLMKCADVALYKAKDHGRNNFQIYSSAMDKMSFQSFFLERDLRKALIQNEFMLHLQPRVNTETQEIIAAEALIRWNHPKFGLVPPTDFIPLAEETGLIVPIGKWVKRKVCELLVHWRTLGIPIVPISINISPQSFLQKDFAENLGRILNKHGLDGNLLEVEITESSLMKNEEEVTRTVSKLKEMGIKIFIDDFGTGYSSISYLKTFKLDGIKIDRSFINNISYESENAGITSAMISLAHLLKMEVVAEGVETDEELQFLIEHKCNQVQGYLFGKSAQTNEFEKLLINK